MRERPPSLRRPQRTSGAQPLHHALRISPGGFGLIVMKFGGTSVGSAERIKGAVEIVRGYREGQDVVVVVSAVSGVTDMLIMAAQRAAAKQSFEALQLVLNIQKKHAEIMDGLDLDSSEKSAVGGELIALISELQNFIQSVSILGEVTPRTLDYISGIGRDFLAGWLPPR